MEYTCTVDLEVNGRNITDFKSWEEFEKEYYEQFALMNGYGMKKKRKPKFGCTVEYVKPSSGEFDWSTVINGRLTVQFPNGKRITFTGVYTLKEGACKADGDNEMVSSIELGALGRIEE